MGLQGAEVILMRLQKAYATKLLQAQPELRKEKHDHWGTPARPTLTPSFPSQVWLQN